MTGPRAMAAAQEPAKSADAVLAFHVLITETPVPAESFSPALRLNLLSLQHAYPSYRHHLFGNEEIRDLLADHFEPHVLAAYDALIPFAYKADLARYCLLYQFGGIYSDLSYLHVQPLSLAHDQGLILFRDVTGFNPAFALSNAVILARPHHKLMEKAVRQIVAHHRKGYFGNSPLDPTGPYMLGRLRKSLPVDTSVIVGTSHLINRDASNCDNIVKLLPDGTLIALRNKRKNSSIHELVPEGGNQYGPLWQEGRVWVGVKPVHRPLPFFARLLEWAHNQLD